MSGRCLPALRLVLASWVAAAGASSVSADEVLLAGGGRLTGTLAPAAPGAKTYQLRTASGVVVSLPQTAVREVLRDTPARAEYREQAPLAADTVEDQWRLAEWCRQHGLPAERRSALARIIELNPDHQRARYGLGFALIDGQWVLPAEARRQQGLELYKGRWRTIQEIDLLEEQARLELAHKDWLQQLSRWRRDLDGPKARDAQAALAGVRDPLAVEPLRQLLAREPSRPVKLLLASTLGQVGQPVATTALVQVSLTDTDEELFHHALDLLVRRKPPRLAEPYIAALRDPSNLVVNRAGFALGRIGDPTAVSPLIDALVTTHTRTLPGAGGGKGETYSQSFSPDGGVGMKSASGPQTLVYRVQNQPVLDALVRLTGASFGYDDKAWRYWHAQEKAAQAAAAPAVSSRRD